MRPEGTPNLDPKGDYLEQAWRQSVYPLAARLGVKMRLPSRQPRTRLAHEAAAWARTQGRFEPYHLALFHAFFAEDLDIGDAAVLAEVARECGLNAEDLAQALAEHRVADDVDEDLMIGRSYGITGVPAFVIGGQILFGVQEETTLTQAIERAAKFETDSGPHRLPHLPINITR